MKKYWIEILIMVVVAIYIIFSEAILAALGINLTFNNGEITGMIAALVWATAYDSILDKQQEIKNERKES